jgi:hypothetical protein
MKLSTPCRSLLSARGTCSQVKRDPSCCHKEIRTLRPRPLLSSRQLHLFPLSFPAHLSSAHRMNINESSTIKYIIYATDYEHHDSAVGLCGETISNYPWVQNVRLSSSYRRLILPQALILSVPSSYVRTVRDSATNGLNFIYQARVHKKYPVKAEAWHNVAFQICGGESELLQATISGTVSFHNPYGFIPAELYGIFPFEVCPFPLWI